MTRQLRELKLLIGKEATNKLILIANTRYLHRVSIPSTTRSQLTELLGTDVMERLIKQYGGTYIHVAANKSQVILFRNAQINIEYQAGVPVNELSVRYAITDSAIRRVIGRTRSDFLKFRNIQISLERKSGWKLRELAERYRLSMSAIIKILKKGEERNVSL